MSHRSSSGPPTSPTLLREIRDLRNQDEWRRFVDQYTPFLTGMLLRRGLSPEDAADLIQETFAAIVDHIGDFQYDPRKRFRGWLATIALRKAWRYVSRDRRREAAQGGTTNLRRLGDQPGDAGAPDDEEQRLSLVLGQLRAALNELEWEVFSRTVLADTSIDEAAKQLSIAAGYAYVCRSRARKTLMHLLKEQGDE
jgi:RNA polymerase sigma-70 factor, ECF subfamily